MALAQRTQKDGAGSLQAVPDLSVHPFGPQLAEGIPLSWLRGLIASSGTQVLWEVQWIQSDIAHHLLSMVQVALFPKRQSCEIAGKWVWWALSISLHAQRVTGVSLAHWWQ